MDNVQQRVKALTETRARVWEEAKHFLDDLKGEEMNAEQRTQWDRYNERIDGLASEADSLLARHQRETEAATIRAAEEQTFGRDPEQTSKSADQLFRDWATGRIKLEGRDQDGAYNGVRIDFSRVMRERELARQGASPAEIRALAWDTGNIASTVPTTLNRVLWEVMQEEISLLRMPTTQITTAGGETMDFPILSTNAIATQVSGQGTTLAGTDPGFSKAQITPTKYAQLVSVANEVLADSGVDIASLIGRQIGRSVGRLVNSALMTTLVGSAFVGSGGTVATGGSLLTPDYEDLVSLVYSVADAYRNGANTAWLMRDSTAGTIRKLRDGAGGTEGAPLWQPMVTGGVSGYRQPDLLLGYPVFTDPGVASAASNAKTVFFGDWSSYYIRLVGSGMTVERNDSVLFQTDQTAFRGKMRAGSVSVDLTAVNLLKQSV